MVSVGVSVSTVHADGDAIKSVLPAHGFAKDWVMKNTVMFYDKDTLFDHIDGEAELYFPYGFDVLATATYINTKNPDLWIVADIYRMGSLLDAFGIYSNFRRSGTTEVAIGAEGFVSSSQLMFYQDRYFVRLQATGTTSLEKDTFLTLGRILSKNLPSNIARPRELKVLEIPDVVPKSERYIAQSLLGYAFFHRGLIADAMLQGEKVQVFVVHEDSKEAVQKAFEQYLSYLKIEGRDVHQTEISDRINLSAIDPLYGKVFVEQSDRYIIGAVRVKGTFVAQQLIERLREKLGSN
jgi:hypothetical protein